MEEKGTSDGLLENFYACPEDIPDSGSFRIRVETTHRLRNKCLEGKHTFRDLVLLKLRQQDHPPNVPNCLVGVPCWRHRRYSISNPGGKAEEQGSLVIPSTQ